MTHEVTGTTKRRDWSACSTDVMSIQSYVTTVAVRLRWRSGDDVICALVVNNWWYCASCRHIFAAAVAKLRHETQTHHMFIHCSHFTLVLNIIHACVYGSRSRGRQWRSWTEDIIKWTCLYISTAARSQRTDTRWRHVNHQDLIHHTPWNIKTCHFVFDYNSGASWSILYFLYQWKQEWILYKENLLLRPVSPHCLVKLKTTQKHHILMSIITVHSIERNFRKKS